MKNFDENELIDKAMAGRLSAEEQQLWALLLVERPELEAELEIGRALRGTPKPPNVSSNFTALVLREVNRVEPQRAEASWSRWFRWPRIVSWAGAAVVVIGLGITLTHQRNEQLVAESVESLAGGLSVVSVVDPDVRPQTAMALAQDFETIRNLPPSVNQVDYDLLAAFNE